jgi:hypothetical protein
MSTPFDINTNNSSFPIHETKPHSKILPVLIGIIFIIVIIGIALILSSAPNDDQDEALEEAIGYIESGSFSHDGLIEQLEFSDYSTTAATYAADNCNADWNAEALEDAKLYLGCGAFSEDRLKTMLTEYDKFTDEEAQYAIDNCFVDWNEQAKLAVKEYQDYDWDFSRADMLDMLMTDGFTAEQAKRAVDAVGLSE